MLRFAQIEMLWWLLLVPVLAVAFYLYTRHKRRQLLEFGDKELVAELMPHASHTRPIIKFILELLAFVLIVVALARPQYGTKEQKIKRQGIEAMLAIDVSNSMLAEDVAPNRLERAKQLLSKLIEQLRDDRIGLIVFAGEAYIQLPITADYVSAKMFLNQISPDLVRTQGTAIGEAIQTGMRAFGQNRSEASRLMVIITDGEDHEQKALDMAKQAAEAGIEIIMVGIGKTDGAPIPVPGTNGFRKDRQGNVVITKLNEQMAQDVAAAANGIYIHCDNTNTALRAIQNEVDKLSKADIEDTVYTEYNEQYQSFVLLAIILLVIDFFVFNRKNKRLSKIDIFSDWKQQIQAQ